jgi:murein tripeptide amidase MpaA
MPYLNVTEVESALIALNIAHPGLCELITLPNLTHEGRMSHAIRVGFGPLDNRPAMLFIGGQHAREWGSCEICINVATDLIDAYIANAGLAYGGKAFTATQVKSIIEKYQIFIFACVNPDGRNHSQTVSPMWRKNRNPAGAVDVNRNYDFLWDFQTAFSPAALVVVSDIPSSDIYHGTTPGSEPETRNVVWLLDTYPQIHWMIDIHSFSGLLYHNWGDDENQVTDPTMNFQNSAHDGQRGISSDGVYREFIPPEDLATEVCLVQEMRDALRAVRGETYSVGQSFALYPTCGTATDYPYSRHWVDSTKTKTLGFLIEWGMEFQPPWLEMENIILDVSSALVAFAIAAPGACSTHLVTAIADDGNFGDVCLGSFADELLTINNSSSFASLEISSITSSSPDFLPPSVISYPLVVGPGDSINVVIRFQPASFGPKAATLSVISNDPASPHTIEVTGEAQAPRLVSLIANTGNFGKVCVDSFMDKPLILSNSGKCTLSVSSITSSSGEFIVPQVMSYPVAIGAGNSLPVPIRFEPGSFGLKSATLTVVTDDPATPHTIDVSGEAPSGKLAITGSLCLGGVRACCTAERTLSICNTGDCKLHVTSVAFKRKSRHWKLINNPFPATLHPGACLGVIIRYKATEKCPRCCELVITSDDPITPVKTLDVMAYTVWNDCKQCSEKCDHHSECCHAECPDDCCDDDNDGDEGEDDN